MSPLWSLLIHSKVAPPLTPLTSALRQVQWPESVEATFSKLKTMVTSAPILSHPNPSRQFIMEVDSSDIGVGAVLSQRDAVD